MSATTGPLTDCLKMLSAKIMMIRRAREESAEKGMRPNAKALSGRNVMMNGIRLPILVWVRSLMALNMGIRNMANILSRVMMVPITAFDSIYFPKKIGI